MKKVIGFHYLNSTFILFAHSRDKHEKELLQLQQEVDKERAQIQETEMSLIRNLQEAMELSSKRMQITKKKVIDKNIAYFVCT